MKDLPLYVPVTFIATMLATLLLFYKALNSSKKVLLGMLLWLAVQAIVALAGFYTVTDTVPPRFVLLVAPPLLITVWLLTTKQGSVLVDGLNTRWLTLLHVVRVPVELCLFWLAMHQYVPQLMTFEGRNFDIFSGSTAPLVFYFGYVKKAASRGLLLLWNFICLALLINIVANAILSAPFPFQKFAFDQPNVALLYFPFVWLPCFIVPVVLLAHLVSIRQLIRRKKEASHQPSVQNVAGYS